MPAFPTQAVSQYDHAVTNPPKSPKASRAYKYGPPEPGTRLLSHPKTSARASAPMVTRTKASRLDRPYGASDDGSAKTPVPMTEPTTSAVAVGRPNRLA